jgi:hypothetical protein
LCRCALLRSIIAAVTLLPSLVIAAPITFATAADYDNNATQTTGLFRDFLNGASISRGLDLGGTGHAALNFTGSDNNAATAGRITLFDTTPSTSAPTFFSGNLSISVDVLISPFNNSKGPGILFLFNEGTGEQGLALSLFDAGNTDRNTVQLVLQTGETRPGTALASSSLGSSIAEDVWYRMVLDLTFSGPNFTVEGQVFNHTVGSNPDSPLGSQIGSTLTYTAAASSFDSPYEIGLVARGDSAVVDSSVTNFDVVSAVTPGALAAPEPPALALLAIGLAALRRTFRPN